MTVSNTDSLKHSEVSECIRNMKLVRVRGKGWTSKRRWFTEELGNCAPAALSYVVDLDYDEVCRRLVMIGDGLAECADLDPDLSEFSRSEPNHGTWPCVWKSFLRLHGFALQRNIECICSNPGPLVVAGYTEPRTAHLVTVIEGEVLSDYDVTRNCFDAVEVWKSEEDLADHGAMNVDGIFSCQSWVTSILRDLVTQDA